MKLSRTKGQLSPAVNFFRSLPVSTACSLPDRRWVYGQGWPNTRHNLLWVTGTRLASGDYLIMVSHDESDQVMADYAKRWEIELLFQSLKERGFNVEDANLKDAECLKL